MNLPNMLTLARCVMAALFVFFMSFPNAVCYFAAYLVFTAAAITDYYDGKIARERNLITNFGKLLDPVADKVLVVAALVMLLTIGDLRIPGWTLVVILAREFLVTGARSLAAADGAVIPANSTGKTKTVIQLVYIFVFLFAALALQVLHDFPGLARQLPGTPGDYVYYIGYASRAGIILVAVYTVYSGIDFARQNWRLFRMDTAS